MGRDGLGLVAAMALAGCTPGSSGDPEWVPWEEVEVRYLTENPGNGESLRSGQAQDVLGEFLRWSGHEGSWVREVVIDEDPRSEHLIEDVAVWDRAKQRVELAAFNPLWVSATTRYGLTLALDDELGLSGPLELDLDLVDAAERERWQIDTPTEVLAWLASAPVQDPLERAQAEVCGLGDAAPDAARVHALLFPEGPTDAVVMLEEPLDWTWWEDVPLAGSQFPALWRSDASGHTWVTPYRWPQFFEHRWSPGDASVEVREHALVGLEESQFSREVAVLGERHAFFVQQYIEPRWVSVDLDTREQHSGTWDLGWHVTDPAAAHGRWGLARAKEYIGTSTAFTPQLVAFDLETGVPFPMEPEWAVADIVDIFWVDDHFEILARQGDRLQVHAWNPDVDSWSSREEPAGFPTYSQGFIPLGGGRWLRTWDQHPNEGGWTLHDTAQRVLSQAPHGCGEPDAGLGDTGLTRDHQGRTWQLARQDNAWRLGVLEP